MNIPTIETHHPRPTPEDYEYAVFDSQYNSNTLPIILVMKYQEGFEWNEELFFSTYRQAQCKRHKSKFRKAREEKIRQACNSTTRDGNNREQDRVMEIELSATDKDILP